jgi:uncharacterized cupin superfamily protein
VAGLTLMGATHVTLAPGGYSSQRHWHRGQDEIVVMIAGEAVLIDDTGDTPVGPGDVLTFPAGEANGHHIHNRSEEPCVFVAISAGSSEADSGVYSDIDMVFDAEGYARKDGTRYEARRTP